MDQISTANNDSRQINRICVLLLTARQEVLTLVGHVTRRLRGKLLKETRNHSESTSLLVTPGVGVGVSVKMFHRMTLVEQRGDGSQQPGKRGYS